MDANPSAMRALPQVQKLIESPHARTLVRDFSRRSVLRAVRGRLEEVRRGILAGEGPSAPFSIDAFFEDVRARLNGDRLGDLRRAVNATGIVIHTNLGRAPLAREAVEAIAEVAGGYANLELDLATGRRGSRYRCVAGLLRELTGAEAALVVNNNAAAVLLALGALAAGGGEVVVSRGELVEIGGSFRIPDIIAQSGARLVEVGTTNKTKPSDYERAITPATRVLLKVHPSNYRVVGFTAAVPAADLVAIGRRHGVPVMEDLGSGALVDLGRYGLPREPTAPEALAAGADLVTFSGDKLLGGPQAGVVLGRTGLVERLKGHPLLRAVRIDKLSLAALEATLRLYLDEERLAESLPVLRMLAQGGRELEERAERLRAALADIGGHLDAGLAEGVAYAGGGSLPEEGIPTRLVTVRPAGLAVDELARRLRAHRPAVVGRITEGRFVMDMRTVADRDVPDIAAAFRGALAP